MSEHITQILSANSAEDIAFCAQIIRSGGTVAFPTETVYGLGADGLSGASVKKIFAAKERPADNPLILHISEPTQAASLFLDVPEAYYKLADAFLPGPLTIIYKKNMDLPDEVTAGLFTVAVRMPANECALSLIDKSGTPIAAPSANRSGRPSPTTAEHVIADLNGRIDAVLDGGKCEFGLESTVLTLATDVPTILRPGAVTPDMLQRVLGEVRIAQSVLHPLNKNEAAASPGMKHKHYAPYACVYVVTGSTAKIAQKCVLLYDRLVAKKKRCIILGSLENEQVYGSREKLILGSRDNAASFCSELFFALRQCDAYDVALCEELPSEGMGLAYMNRLLRAAAFKLI